MSFDEGDVMHWLEVEQQASTQVVTGQQLQIFCRSVQVMLEFNIVQTPLNHWQSLGFLHENGGIY